MEMTKEEKLATIVADGVNNIIFSPEAFCKAMEREHRTLQQTFTNLCIEWLKTVASKNYCFDARNEASHEIAREIASKVDLHNLPTI